jgi:Ni,Fe-hydrogenase III large subunit
MLSAFVFGARAGRLSSWKQWLLKTGFQTLKVFIVPGEDVLRALGLELASTGLTIARNPREADILLITGPLPAGLAENAAVIFAQMPRPRLLAVMGELDIAPLPAPAIRLPLTQAGLLALRPEACRLLTAQGWAPEAQPFAPAFIEQVIAGQQEKGDHKGSGSMNHSAMEPGGMDMEGMMKDLDRSGMKPPPDAAALPVHGPHEHHSMPKAADKPSGEETTNEPAADGQHAHHTMPPTDTKEPPAADSPDPGHHQPHAAQAGHEHSAIPAGPMPHTEGMDMPDMMGDQMKPEAGAEMPGMDMSGMDMGFMSMVEMTKDLPRSADGLPMEASEAAFGPFFPGLPGGLNLRLHLDGDNVTKAVITPGQPDQSRADRLPLPAREFAPWLAGLDPLTPAAYHLLAHRALAQAMRLPATAALPQLIALEQERIASHLNWLIDFGVTIGHAWLRQAAEHLYWQLRQVPDQPAAVTAFVRQVRRLPLLRQSLTGVGQIPAPLLHHARGPVAKAAGISHDARQLDPLYQQAGFVPIVRAENNVWGRLQVRLQEMLQSQELVHRLARLDPVSPTPTFPTTDQAAAGTGRATVETPRGTATLEVALQSGQVTAYTLHAPSALHVALVNEFVREQELGDALKTIASLDISPWTITA